MAMAPIGGVAGVGGVGGAAGTSATSTVGTTQAPKIDFSQALDSVAKTGQQADALSAQAATGQLQDVHQLMAAQAKAALAVELTVAVRDRAVEAYQEIMRMQI